MVWIKVRSRLLRLPGGHFSPSAVLITPEQFDELNEHERFLEAVREGLTDADAGRVVDDETLSAHLDSQLGPNPGE